VAGPVFRFFAWPLIFLTLGLFLLVVNAVLLKLASLFTPGFSVHGFFAALAGSMVLTILNSILRYIVFHTGPLWNTM
jgi:putative membrane protein